MKQKKQGSKTQTVNSHKAVQDATVHLFTLRLCDGLQSRLYNCASHQHGTLTKSNSASK